MGEPWELTYTKEQAREPWEENWATLTTTAAPPPVAKGPEPWEQNWSAPTATTSEAPSSPFGPPPVVSSPPAPSAPEPEPPPPATEHNAFMRGLVSTSVEQNPTMTAEAFEGFSHLAPESLRDPLLKGAEKLRGVALLRPEEYKTRSKGLWNIQGVDDAVTWGLEGLGSAIGSSLPSLVTGAGGAAVGGLVGGPVGATVGGVGGALVPSAALNYGEVYKALKDEKVDPKEAAKYAGIAAVPIAALDVASLGSIVGRFGKEAIRKDITQAVAKRIAFEAGRGARSESITEAIQETIKDAMVSWRSGKPFFTTETAKGVIEAGALGAIGGGAMGGALGVFPGGRPTTANVGGTILPNETVVTPEEIAAQIAAGGIPGQTPTAAPPAEPVGPSAVPPATEGVQPPPLPTEVTSPPAPPPTLPANTPMVRIEDGMVVTRTIHGSADSYVIGVEEEGRPTFTAVDEALAPPVENLREEVSEPVQGLYSRLRDWVATKGPENATAARWVSLLNRGEFTREEVRDLGLPTWIGGGSARITKGAVLDYLDANAAVVYEVTRRPITKEEKAAIDLQIRQQIAEVANRDPTAIRITPTGRSELNYDHPEIERLMDEQTKIGRASGFAQYANYTTPGPMESYTELTMHLPPRQSIRPPIKRGREKIFGAGRAADYYGKHYDTPNEIVTIRMAIRRTPEGRLVAVLEEMQSDLHQAAAASTAPKGRRRTPRGYGPAPDEEFMKAFEELVKKAKVRIPRDWNDTPHPRMFQYAVARGVVTQEQVARYIQEVDLLRSKKMPDTPFKESWAKLGFTRFLMWAAERGINHVAWADTAEQMRRYPQQKRETEEQLYARRKGMEAFYYRTLTGIAKEWKRRLGGTLGYTNISRGEFVVQTVDDLFDPTNPGQTPWQVVDARTGENLAGRVFEERLWAEEWAITNGTPFRYQSLQLPETAIAQIQMGMPDHARVDVASVDMSAPATPQGKVDAAAVEPLRAALESLLKKLNIKVPIKIIVHPGTIRYIDEATGKTKVKAKSLGVARRWFNENQTAVVKGEIHINLARHRNAAHLWATMVHEAGHIIMLETLRSAPTNVQNAIMAAYNDFVVKNADKTGQFRNLFLNQSNAVSAMMTDNIPMDMKLGTLSQTDYEYWTGFNEWFAEQVARWGTSRLRPITHVEKFFKGLGKKIVEYLEAASKLFGFKFEANQALADYLDTFLADAPNIGVVAAVQTMQATTAENAAQMDQGETAAPQQVENGPLNEGIGKAFNGRPPKEVQRGMAYADKFNWFYKLALGIHQVAVQNPHIQALQTYVELVRMAQLTKQQIRGAARDVLKLWERLGETQANAVSALIDAAVNGEYLTPDEVKAKTIRHPTQAELTTMAQKHGVSAAGLAVYGRVGQMFDQYLTKLEEVLLDETNKISNPVQKDIKRAAIAKQIAQYRSAPYFPAMRFGSWTITVRDAANKVIHFETFETQGRRDKAMKEFEKNRSDNFKPQAGFLDKQSRPFLGLPTPLMKLIADRMTLTDKQIEALEELSFELAPAQSFKHRFQRKSKEPAGYSMDFRRAFANYFFHGSNYLMKVKYADRMRAAAKMMKDEVVDAPNVSKRDRIAQYVDKHIGEWLNPGSDWAALQGVAAAWQLAGVPSAASQNLGQTLITTYTFLGSQFGDVKAIAAIAKAGRTLENFYSKGRLQKPTNFEQKAISQGIEDGIIQEAAAPEIAGYADGNVLGLGFGGNKIQRGWIRFMEHGMFMFEMAEQFNRRVVFRAALDLAAKNPNTKYVKETVAKNQLLFQQRRDEGWTESEATAYVVAYDATFITQFPYSREFAPRFLKGKARAFLVFKTFIQNYLFFLQAYPAAGVRSLLIVAALYGLMGLPGTDDVQDLIRVLWYRVFGEDMKVEHEVRKLIIGWFGEDKLKGDYYADLVLHGLARRGFGIPQAVDFLEATVGVDLPYPTFDRSKAGAFGSILPIDADKLWGPPLQTTEKVLAEQVQKAVGPVFGLGFATHKALFSAQADYGDWKNWEQMLPRSLANVSKATRAWREGGSRTSTGSMIVKYDVRDNEQMAEVIGMSLGYQPFRQSYEWEKVIAQQDGIKGIEIRRTALMKQFGNATIGKDKDEMERLRGGIRHFNNSLPPEHKSMAITSEGLEKSVRNRAEERTLQERGLTRQKSKIPVMRDVEEKMYPGSQKELRKVPRNLTP